MGGVEDEFVDHVLPGQRLLRAAAQMRLPLLDGRAIRKPCLDVARVAVRVRILQIDHEFDLGRERKHARVADRAVRERAEPDAAMDKAGRQQIRHREFGGIAVGRALFGALMFAAFDALQLRIQQEASPIIPYQLFLALPYVLSIIAMVVIARGLRYPKALFLPFRRGER